MTPELVATIGQLVKKGATIIGNPPVKSPSLVNYPKCDSLVKSIAEIIWGKGEIPEELTSRDYGSGKILYGKKLKDSKLISPVVKRLTQSLSRLSGDRSHF